MMRFEHIDAAISANAGLVEEYHAAQVLIRQPTSRCIILVGMTNQPELRVRFVVDDQSLSELHARAFGQPAAEIPEWSQRLQRHSVSWVGAFDREILVGFVHACWDGGVHAFLLDAVVDPPYQHRGIGRALVHRLTQEVANSGCRWLHVDYEPHLAGFYEEDCGFRTTHAGLIQLVPPSGARPDRHTGTRKS